MRKFSYTAAFLSVLALISGIVGCTTEEQLPEPEISFSPVEVNVSGDGGEYSVGYSVENPVEGAVLMAQADYDWAHDFVCGDDEISFVVDANGDGTARENVVTVAYGEGVTGTFKIVQGEASDPFEIVVSQDAMTETTATISVYPLDKEVTYLLMTAEKDHYERLESEGTAFQTIIDYLRNLAIQNGMSMADFMEANNILRTGDTENAVFRNFYPSSKHYLMAVGCSPDGEQLTDLTAAYFQTKTPDKIDMNFEFGFSVEDPEIVLSVKPDIDDQYYFYYLVKTGDLDRAGMTVEDYMNEVMIVNINYAASYGITPEELVPQLCVKGESSQAFNLVAGTEFLGVAAAVSDNCWIISDIATDTFVTDPIEMSDNVLDVRITELNVEHVKLSVTTTNDDPYAVVITRKGDLSGSDEEIIENILYYPEMINEQPGGDWEGYIYRLEAENSYEVYVFGYDQGVATTGLKKVGFTTLKPGDPTKFSFVSEVSKKTTRGATVTVKPSPITVLYFFDVAPVGMTEEEILSDMDANIQRFINFGLYPDRLTYIRDKGVRGEQQVVYENLDQGVEYVIWAVSADENTGDYVVFGFGEKFELSGGLSPEEMKGRKSDIYPEFPDVVERFTAEDRFIPLVYGDGVSGMEGKVYNLISGI